MIKLPYTVSYSKAEDKLHECFDGDERIVLYEVYEDHPTAANVGLRCVIDKQEEGRGWWIIGTPADVETEMERLGITRYEDKAELGWKED